MDDEKTIIHHAEIRRRLRSRYSVSDVRERHAFLKAAGTLDFTPLPSGLHPAAAIDPGATLSGYENVWTRDNVYVALAQESAGERDAARRTIGALAAFYGAHRARMERIVSGEADPGLPMNRPHVRFDGYALAENPSVWPHAQNDALGYFLWMYSRLALAGDLPPDEELIALFVLYFEAIRYWEDEDSGHWEERRKIEASSIGVVVAALEVVRTLFLKGVLSERRHGGWSVSLRDIDRLLAAGRTALASILPAECVQPDHIKRRRYDSALLFLVWPLEVVDEAMGRQIVADVVGNLQGDYGVRRYLGDSYWTADYKDKLPASERAADVSERQEERDALARLGEEAQWCIFDPILSVIAGAWHRHSGNPADLERQIFHLNRSLGQLTGPDCPLGGLRCPEAYYLERGRYVPNDHVPLLWTQANLTLALLAMEESAARTG